MRASVAPCTSSALFATTRRVSMRSWLTALSMALVVLVALSGPALAQDGDGQPYPPPPNVKVTTPNAVITVTGEDWGPDTEVEIVARDRSAGAGSSQALAFRRTARVGPDGRFEAPITVPPSQPGSELVIEIAGQDVSGAERRETQVYAIASSANAAQGSSEASPSDVEAFEPVGADEGGPTRLHVLLAGLAVIGIGIAIRRRAKA